MEMERIFHFFKTYVIPRRLFAALQPLYHFLMSFFAALSCGFPSRKIVVIGVTGTTGKTTTIFMAAKILTSAGYHVGYTSTALLGDGAAEWLNDKKMTMVGRFFTQKMIARMVRNKCDVALIETTSEGIRQFRHRFINYDMLVFTGLYPEHIESHGSFEKYKTEKQKLFAHLARCAHKTIRGKKIPKTIIVNGDDAHMQDFLRYDADEKMIFSQKDSQDVSRDVWTIRYKLVRSDATDTRFTFNATDIHLALLGDFTATNAAAAGCIARAMGLSDDAIKSGLERVRAIPGRLEQIKEGQPYAIIVDYAFEPNAIAKLYDTVEKMHPRHIIHVLGSAGGGRDVARRARIGAIAGMHADVVIVTNEDPYDDDPTKIIDDVFDGVIACDTRHAAGDAQHPIRWVEGKNCFRIMDRRAAIKKALLLAREGDIVLITGKGSEQAICVRGGKKIPWDDRRVVRDLLQHAQKGDE